MKALPCDNGECRSVGWAMLRNGEPHLCGQVPTFPFTVSCARCLRTTEIDAVRYHMLPEVTPDDLERFGLLDAYARELTLGGEFKASHARDLYRAGFTSAGEVEAVPRPEPRQ